MNTSSRTRSSQTMFERRDEGTSSRTTSQTIVHSPNKRLFERSRDEACTSSRTRSSQIKGCLNVGMKVQALVLVQAKQSYTRSSQIKGCLNERSDAINQLHTRTDDDIFIFLFHHSSLQEYPSLPALMVFPFPLSTDKRLNEVHGHSHHCFNCPSITFRWQICLNKHQV